MEIESYNSEDSITLIYKYSNLHRIAICDISKIENGNWLINRVNVPINKGAGIGTALVKKGIEILKSLNAKTLTVYPGGYNSIHKKTN